LPAELTDAQWWNDAEQRYEEYWREFLGEPETFETGARWFYGSGEFGTALLLYQKAIDLLHTRYCFDTMRQRRPSAADLPIVDGYLSALGASLSLHPDAPVADSIAEAAHRLEDIRAACNAAGLSTNPYRQGLIELKPYARRFGVHINTAVLAEPKSTVINNGIMASHSVVTGNNVASAPYAHATIVGTPQDTPHVQIAALLDQFVALLARSGRPDGQDLTDLAVDVRSELATPTPRIPRLKALASGLASAVAGASSLATLASQIEQAIHGL
jgi:hypothetical protein